MIKYLVLVSNLSKRIKWEKKTLLIVSNKSQTNVFLLLNQIINTSKHKTNNVINIYSQKTTFFIIFQNVLFF